MHLPDKQLSSTFGKNTGPVCSNMGVVYLEITILSEVSQTGEISYDIPYMWNLKGNDTNELTKQKETHRLRERTYGCLGEG